MSYTIERIQAKWQYNRKSGAVPRLIVCHICDGYYEGTKAYFQTTDRVVSSHYIVGQEGQVCECVPITKFACCNGTTTDRTVSTYYGYSTVPLVKQIGGNVNDYSVSIECEGLYSKTQGELTVKQLDALVWLIRKIQGDVAAYGHTIPLDREHIVGHYEINPRTKPNCPGQNFPWKELMSRLDGEVSGGGESYYRVQVGAFANRTNADTRRLQLAALGIDAFVSVWDGLYRVQAGAFSNPALAERQVKILNELGYSAIVVRR